MCSTEKGLDWQVCCSSRPFFPRPHGVSRQPERWCLQILPGVGDRVRISVLEFFVQGTVLRGELGWFIFFETC